MIFDMPDCGGCRTCELACSFYHLREFNPIVSSIKILNKKDERGYLVKFIGKKEGFASPCDGCQTLKEPLCLQYCRKSDILEKMIREFLNIRNEDRK